MKSILDDFGVFEKMDPQGMLKAITMFPESAGEALNNAAQLKPEETGFDSILVVGMGGSAVGGLLLRDWLMDYLHIPITVSRGYHLPAWVNQKTLVFAVSYSGNTEETLSQYKEAVKKGCTIICFCSGGELEKLAGENNHKLMMFPKGQQPRAAIPYQFYNLAGVTRGLDLIDDHKWDEIEESINVVRAHCEELNPETPSTANPAKIIAHEIKDYIPFIYAPRLFRSVAYRYSTQFNENSKIPAATNFYPEAFHNSVMAMEGPDDLLKNICAVIIKDPEGYKRLEKKIGISLRLMEETFGKVLSIEAEGKTRLARLMSALIQGDYVSAYLGILYGNDPSTTASIGLLKASMDT